jgi:hypothetical protein
MAEDVEYIDLLSLAARAGAKDSLADTKHPAALSATSRGWDIKELEGLEGDEASLMRLMLVSAFAMSNYSSTVDRTSKVSTFLLNQ